MTIEIRTAANYDLDASWATFASGEYEVDTDGIRTWKMADDLERYRAIIEATKPEVIVETGTKFGGSARWFKSLGLDVITVDIDDEYSGDARRAHPDIHWIIGNTLDPAVMSCIVDLIDGRRTMVSLDSEHATPHVLAEIGLYGPLVTPGCYLVVEDGIFDLIDPSRSHLGGGRIPAEGGPLRAIAQTLARDPGTWRRDLAIEKMSPRSYHPAGFWAKKEPKVAPVRKAAKARATSASETAAILADPQAMADIAEGQADIAAGRLTDAVALRDTMEARRHAA